MFTVPLQFTGQNTFFFCTYVANITHTLVLRLSFLKLQPQDQEQFEKKTFFENKRIMLKINALEKHFKIGLITQKTIYIPKNMTNFEALF